MQNRYFFYLLIVVVLLTSCKAARQRKHVATDHIIDLKEGILLVRLHSGALKVQAMERAGFNEKAQEVTEQKLEENKAIREAFDQYFDYCPVYYFYARHSEKIRGNQTEGYLTDAAGNPVDPIDLDQIKFLAAEFNRIQPPAAQSGMPALIVLGDSLQQLPDPFPFHVRTTFLGKGERFPKAVRMLNNNFIEYYSQARIWREKQLIREQRRALRQKSKQLD